MDSAEEDKNNVPKKEDCKYGDKCYQRNEPHRRKYNHPEPAAGKGDSPQAAGSKDDPPQPSTSKDDPPQPSTSKDDPPQPAVPTPEAEKNGEASKEKNGNSKKRAPEERTDEVDERPTKRNNPQRLWQQPDEEYSELLKSNNFIHSKFGVKMPKDFYELWEFIKFLRKDTEAQPFIKYNLLLVGPYDYISGKFDKATQKSPAEYLRHWRFYYDPPEFQTIFVKKGTGIHYGYWRDDPNDVENIFIARNNAAEGCKFTPIASNAFTALAHFLEKEYKQTPFNARDLDKLRKTIGQYATENGICRNSMNSITDRRLKAQVAKTFHGLGIIVPVRSATGYRPLIESDANLKKILSLLDNPENPKEALDTVMEKLQPVISAATIALDECDFGTSLELGLDLFLSGHKQLHSTVQELLKSAYMLLERTHFVAVLKSHLECRKKSFELSILN